MICLNYLMACTVFAQTLTTRCCCVCSSEGVNLSATSGYACQNPSLPPYLCPSTSIIPASLHVSWPSLSPILSPRRVMMTMSPLTPVSCSDCVLRSLYIVRLGLLYFGVKSRHYKKHVKKEIQPRDWTQKKGMTGRGLSGGLWDLCWWQSMIWSLLSVSVVNVVAVSVLMLIFLSVVLARTLKNTSRGLKWTETASTLF